MRKVSKYNLGKTKVIVKHKTPVTIGELLRSYSLRPE